MNRTVQWLNLAGVLLLAGLCAAQWRQDGELHSELRDATAGRAQQTATIGRQEKTIEEQRADLNDFRGRLAAAGDAARDANVKFAATTTQHTALLAERDQLEIACHGLQTALDQWKGAVGDRDEALKKANTLAQQLAADRNGAVVKYNDLVSQYNTAAAEIKKAAATIDALAAQRTEAVARFNDLAAKYNALVSEKSTTTTPSH